MTAAVRPAAASCARIAGRRREQQGPGRGRPNALRARGLRERAWWLMRQVKRFTLDDLLLTLAEGHEADAPGNLLKYARQLERTGILKRLQRRAPGASPCSNGAVIWQVARDLGREPPVWREKQLAVYDPNSQTLIALLDPQPGMPKPRKGAALAPEQGTEGGAL